MPYCTYCGIANIADAKFCKSCAARIGVPIINIIAPDAPVASAAPVVPVATVTQAMAATARLPLKSPLGAALLSWMWPGLGHCYAGRVGVGVALAVFVPVLDFLLILIAAFTVEPLPLIGILIVAIMMARSAANDARQVNAIGTNARACVRSARGAGYASPS